MSNDTAALLQHFEIASAPEGSAAALETFNPADASLLARVPASSAADYEAVLARALSAARSWAEVPAPARGQLVRHIGDELRLHKQELATLVALENGKIMAEALGEVQEMIDIADFAVGQSRQLYGRTMHSERPQHRMYEQWHPLGVVGIVTAFNFPVAVWSWNALIAAICGNACVWKPSAKTPLCALAVQWLSERVLERHQAPPVFQLLLDHGAEHGQRLAADARVALLSFTGSTAVGRRVGQTVAARLGKSLLELGGNNAIIVDETADIDLAARAIVFGALGTAGQRCTTTRRVIVHRAHLQALQQRLVHAYRQAPIGDPLDPKTLVGPLIDAQAVRAYEGAIAAARAAGGEVLVGGEVLARPGHFVQPAIVLAQNHWEIVQHETFAPILYLIPADSLEQAIELHNQSAYGLSSALFTQRLANAERYLSQNGSDCGIANINIGTSGAEIGGAFGGEKDTGGGREAGSDSWKAYMRRQTNTINWSAALPLAQGIEFESAPR
ncbi:MAG TPA: aldehyde dehydrogenase family protein [Steroidobacteraceae bacterium]|jgi:aldehyde dehydrogenase (NAD+)|nr:aldehyde dehydrogenase family protein [Steroidobacteraceae bacterium]